jgi:hypothetical protein
VHLHTRKGLSKPLGEYALYHYFVVHTHPCLNNPVVSLCSRTLTIVRPTGWSFITRECVSPG